MLVFKPSLLVLPVLSSFGPYPVQSDLRPEEEEGRLNDNVDNDGHDEVAVLLNIMVLLTVVMKN